MKFEVIDTSSVYAPIGHLFVAIQENCDDDFQFLLECFEKDGFSFHSHEKVEVKCAEVLSAITLIKKDLFSAKKESKLIHGIENIMSAAALPHNPSSSGNSFLIRCKASVFYINWYRES